MREGGAEPRHVFLAVLALEAGVAVLALLALLRVKSNAVGEGYGHRFHPVAEDLPGAVPGVAAALREEALYGLWVVCVPAHVVTGLRGRVG